MRRVYQEAANAADKFRALQAQTEAYRRLSKDNPNAKVGQSTVYRHDGILLIVTVDSRPVYVKSYNNDWSPRSKQNVLSAVQARLATPETSTVRNASVDYVLKRMAQTFVPSAKTGVAPYTSIICHAQVARAIFKRGNPEDHVVLFGDESGNVIHSILVDENDKVVVDTWKSSTSRYEQNKGYWKDGTLLELLFDEPVSWFYDEYQR